MDESMYNGIHASQMASIPIAFDWDSFPIWCCGKFFPAEEIPQHAQENHNKRVDKSPGIYGNVKMVTDKSPGIEIYPTQFKTNTSDGGINNNSIERGREKSDKNRADQKYYCEQCVYTSKQKSNIKSHVDIRHLGIRHECEVCQVSYTTRYWLNQHKKNKHESLHVLETLTTIPNISQTQNEDVAEINREIDTAHLVATLPLPENQSVIDEIKREIITPPPSPQSQMDDSETKQKIETTSLLIFANHKDEVPSENHKDDVPSESNHNVLSAGNDNDAVSAETEIKEEIDLGNLQVPAWRIFPEFEHPPLNEKDEVKAGSTEEVEAVGLEEQERIAKLHAKLEKEEKQRKKWDNKWWKRRAEIQKLKEAKDRDNGKDVKKEEEEIELFWPNEDVITDIVIMDDTREDNKEAKDNSHNTVQNMEGVENAIELVQDDLGQGTEECDSEQNSVIMDNIGIAVDTVSVVQENGEGGDNDTYGADDSYAYGQYGDDSMSGYDDAGGMINSNTGMPIAGVGGADGNKEMRSAIRAKMYRASSGQWQCTDCDYSSNRSSCVSVHIEAKHLETRGLFCSICNKFCPTRNAFNIHKARYHKRM